MKIIELKGVGKKTEEQFARLGVETTDDLAVFFPHRYEKMPKIAEADDVVVGETYAVRGRIKRMHIGAKSYYAYLEGMKQKINLIWFQTEYLVKHLRPGTSYVFLGSVTEYQGDLQMTQPKVYELDEYLEVEGTLQPVYPLTKGLHNATVQRIVKNVIRSCSYPEILPDFLIQKFNLYSMDDAIVEIHQPSNETTLERARKRLIFNEFFTFLLALQVQKNDEIPNRYQLNNMDITDRVVKALPYKLTSGQLKCWEDIKTDVTGDCPMMRLIQGDVGCGKSIIAFLSLLQAAANGYQSCLMAPTEVLARQHYKDIVELISFNNLPYKAVVLTGGLTQKDKRKILDQIESGEAAIIIGTHALIEKSVKYKQIGLVVMDELHRFGVMQREALSQKGQDPHVLIMSATPIPRTMAMTLYADLDTSAIKEQPAHRLPIKNSVLDKAWRHNIWNFVKKEVDKGRQAYIICSMIERIKEVDYENVNDYAEAFRKQFPDIACEILHGKMNQDEKDDIMQRFISGEVKVLISTTVIEVGINVPNASTIVIEDANTFGLSQLHQLRGRVGRGSYQSYCIFVSNNDEGKKKLEVIAKNPDGFKIAEEDLRMRGAGELTGTRQSGDMNFDLADIYEHAEILEEAASAVEILGGVIMQTKKILNKKKL